VRGVVAAFRNRGLVALMLGHFTVDSYVGLLPIFYPLLIHRFQLNLATVALVSLAYTGTASISQPLFGHFADRWGTRLTGWALAWTAATFAAVGFVPTFPLLVAVAAASGLGSGAFHPLGALTVRRLLPKRGANTAMSVYVTGGTLGLAAGPLIGVLIFGAFGSRGTATMLLPGMLIGAFLLVFMRRPQPEAPSRAVAPRPAAGLPALPIVAIVAVMASRSWTSSTFQTFTPTWYHELGYPPRFYGLLATTLILASALGTVGTGSLADRFGRRAMIIGSLVLSVPAVALFVAFPGPQAFVWAILVGGLAASTVPLMMMLAQELMSGRAGFASGLILGLGFVSAAVGAPVTGLLADHIGLQLALAGQVLVVLATIPIAFLLPSEGWLLKRSAPPAAVAPGIAVAGGD
jgi:FSR family fosmidomycin resistance protein-like MFS transporter